MYFLNKNVLSCYLLNLTFIMRDNLIFDPIKQFWIKLEFYFESYEFYNFRNFSRNFLNFYEFNLIYFELKLYFYHVMMWPLHYE